MEERTICVKKSLAATIDSLLRGEVKMSEDDTIIETADFGNGIEVDVKCCGADEETAWAEAVLFQNGSECCYSEVEYEFFGDWIFEFEGNTYIVHVRKGE